MKSSFDVLYEKANHDFITVENLLKFENSPTDTMAFHLQQMIEKLLKCLLIKHNMDFRPSHDLFYLLNYIEEIYPEYSEFYDLAEKLSPHAVINRYEEGYLISKSEFEKLYKDSISFRNTILKTLNSDK